ncbi:hypothetical protein AAKU64_003698 [Undibacterium sp. GrIS 1.8]
MTPKRSVLIVKSSMPTVVKERKVTSGTMTCTDTISFIT